MVDDVLVARIVACRSSMERGPKSDDTTPTTWSRYRLAQVAYFDRHIFKHELVSPITFVVHTKAPALQSVVSSLHLNEAYRPNPEYTQCTIRDARD